jgi:membrane-associated phospholipid phosphatase
MNTNNYHKILWLFCFFIFINQTGLNASIYPKSRYDKKYGACSSGIARDIEHFIQTGRHTFLAPFHFSTKDWSRLLGTLGGTIMLFTIDQEVQTIALSNQYRFNDCLFNWDQFYGDKYTFAFTLFLYGSGWLFKNSNIRWMGLQALEAFIYSGLVTQVTKFVLGRGRPYVSNNQLIFRPFNLNNDYLALPSGHSTAAFAVSTILAKSVDNPAWKTVWYGTAVMTAASRVYHNQHWASDVFLGAIMGYSVAQSIMNIRVNCFGISNKCNPKNPYIYYSSYGLGIILPF